MDLGHLRVVQDAVSVHALVTKDDDFWCCKEELEGRDCRVSMSEMVDDMVNVIKVPSYEASYASDVRNSLILILINRHNLEAFQCTAQQGYSGNKDVSKPLHATGNALTNTKQVVSDHLKGDNLSMTKPKVNHTTVALNCQNHTHQHNKGPRYHLPVVQVLGTVKAFLSTRGRRPSGCHRD
jgi:hypothetical protein